MLSSLRKKWRDMRPSSMFALGITIGVAIGIVIGIAINNLVIGIPIGAGVGVAIGLVLEERRRTVQSRPGVHWKGSARPHHYIFAHMAVRNRFFDNPTTFVAALGNRRQALLEEMWANVGRWVEAKEGKEAALPSDGLALTVREVGPGSLALIISLPPPEDFTEAHFVGLLLHPPRFITLEHGFSFAPRGTRTVLCEWTGRLQGGPPSGVHANVGDGPEATVDAFAETLSGMVSQEDGEQADAAAPPEASSQGRPRGPARS